MNDAEAMKERRIAWIMLIVCPLSMIAMFAYVTAGYAPGLDAGHPMEYLQSTCILWAGVMIILPALRLGRYVSLPLWFLVLVYGDMYLYVISLCQGMYLNVSWWGDMTHVIAAIIVTAIVFVALCLMQERSPGHVTFGSNRGILLMLFFISMSFGGLWELMEGLTDALSGQAYMIYGATDSLGDLTADMIGVTFMVIVAYLILRKQSTADVTSKIRFGRNSIKL